MKNKQISKKGLYVGAGAGIVIFVLSGLLPGSFIGGTIGVNIATKLFGTPLGLSLLPKVIILISMLAGIMTAGVFIIIATSSLGWIIGSALDAALNHEPAEKKAIVDTETKNSVS